MIFNCLYYLNLNLYLRLLKNSKMKKTLILFVVLIMNTFQSYSQADTKSTIFFNGLYVAKTGGVPAANIEIFSYLKFYDDGIVYLQSVSSNDPESVAKWFGRDKKFSQKGTYKIDGENIIIQINNNDSEDFKLEGHVETKYKGTIKKNNQLCLIRDLETEEKCFTYSKTQ